MLDEVAQHVQRLAAGGGEAARAVLADEGHIPVGDPPVEVAAHLFVDLVLGRPPGLGHA